MPTVALARRYGPILALCLPLIIAGSWAGAGSATSMASEPVIIIGQRDCNQLAVHYLADGISAMFDDDELERASATADSPVAVRLAMLEDIAIDITGDIQQRLGLSPESILVRSEAGVGNVVVKRDGSAAINGQTLSDTEGYALAALCRIHGQTLP